jgi:15-cis-phytoene synthase
VAGVARGDVGAAMKSRDTSFYYSFLVLPPDKRNAIVAVWDFCRAVDDAVDEIAPDPLRGEGLPQEIRPWRAELAAVYGGQPTTPQGSALQPFVKRFNLPQAQFEALIDGVEMDLSLHRYPNFDTLVQYCHRVASSVGLICVEIFGYEDPRSRDYAISLGVALQLTNIVRDVAVDLKKGRVYLPTDDMAWFHVTEDELRAGVATPRIRQLLRYQCRRARQFYQQASASLPAADARSLVAAQIMGAIYFGILRRIERARYDVFSQIIRVPRWRRALMALQLWTSSMLLPPSWRRI